MTPPSKSETGEPVPSAEDREYITAGDLIARLREQDTMEQKIALVWKYRDQHRGAATRAAENALKEARTDTASKAQINLAVNRSCSCGGREPGTPSTCPACEVWHRLFGDLAPPKPVPLPPAAVALAVGPLEARVKELEASLAPYLDKSCGIGGYIDALMCDKLNAESALATALAARDDYDQRQAHWHTEWFKADVERTQLHQELATAKADVVRLRSTVATAVNELRALGGHSVHTTEAIEKCYKALSATSASYADLAQEGR